MDEPSGTTTGRSAPAATGDEPAPARRTTMKAVVQDAYGDADVLRLAEIATPEVGDGQVLVRVRAAGVDRAVVHLMTGLPYLLRLAGYGLHAPKNRVRGREVAGRVEATGKDVTRFRTGDEVMGTCEGSFAEYVCADEDKLATKPAKLTFAEAAALPVSATTALQALREQGHVQPGQRVLVIGASGGVGTFAVQLAKAFGAEVTGVCSTAKVDLVRAIGADHVIDYTRDDEAEHGQYDLILDIGGNRSLSRLRRVLTRRGRLVIVGGEGGGRWVGGIDRQLRALALSPFVRQDLRMIFASEHHEDLELLAGLIEAGQVTPVLDTTYPLRDAPDAVRHLAAGRARGKVVITV